MNHHKHVEQPCLKLITVKQGLKRVTELILAQSECTNVNSLMTFGVFRNSTLCKTTRSKKTLQDKTVNGQLAGGRRDNDRRWACSHGAR